MIYTFHGLQNMCMTFILHSQEGSYQHNPFIPADQKLNGSNENIKAFVERKLFLQRLYGISGLAVAAV